MHPRPLLKDLRQHLGNIPRAAKITRRLTPMLLLSNRGSELHLKFGTAVCAGGPDFDRLQ